MANERMNSKGDSFLCIITPAKVEGAIRYL